MAIVQMYNDSYKTSQIQTMLGEHHIELNGISEVQSTGKLHVDASFYAGMSDGAFQSQEWSIKSMIRRMTGREVDLHICKMPPQGPVIMRSW